MSQQPNHQEHDLHKEITIENLKAPPLRIPPAPVVKRVVAAIIDSLIIGAVWLIVMFADRPDVGIRAYVGAASLAAVTFAYYFPQEWIFASTIGKKFQNLRVVGRAGDPATLSESLIRNLLRLVDWLPALYLLGAVTLATSSQRRRVGDVAAGTFVTTFPEKDINPPPAPFLFH